MNISCPIFVGVSKKAYIKIYGRYLFKYYIRYNCNTQIKIISPKIDLNRFLNNEDPIVRIDEIYKISDPNKDLNTLFIFPEGILTGVSLQNQKYLSYLFKNRYYSCNNIQEIGFNMTLDNIDYGSI